jgi:hypothetical protein
VKPFKVKVLNQIEIMNELNVIISSYFLIVFTDYMDEPYLKWNIGWVLMAVNVLNIGANMVIILKIVIIELKGSIKERCRKFRNKNKVIDINS